MLIAATHRLSLARRGRQYASLVSNRPFTRERERERISVPVRNDGHIFLDIHYPQSAPHSRSSCNLNAILHLPSGLPKQPSSHSHHDQAFDEHARFATRLATATTTPVVTLHYRLSTRRPFPSPIFDVLAGYDWICRRVGRARIGLTGEHIGGGLAMMLGLTECRERGGVVAVGVENAVVDWVGIDRENSGRAMLRASDTQRDISDTGMHLNPKLDGLRLTSDIKAFWNEGHDMKHIGLDTQAEHASVVSPDSNPGERRISLESLVSLRSKLFPTPSRYFDDDASPLLKLRTPGVAVPKPSSESLGLDFEELHAAESGVNKSVNKEEKKVKRYKIMKSFPPTGHALVMPRTRIAVDAGSVLHTQAAEMVKYLRRNLASASSGNSDKVKRLSGSDHATTKGLTSREPHARDGEAAKRSPEEHVTFIEQQSQDETEASKVEAMAAWFRAPSY